MEQFGLFIDKIVGFLGGGGIVAALVFIVELVFRLVKTDKPMSILLGVSAFLKKAIAFVMFATEKLVALLKALDGLLDKIIPQNVAAPEIKLPKQ